MKARTRKIARSLVRFREERDAQGLTRKDIAARVGKSKEYIDKIELGRRACSLSLFEDLVQIGLGMNMRAFYEPWEDKPPKDTPLDVWAVNKFRAMLKDPARRRLAILFVESIEDIISGSNDDE